MFVAGDAGRGQSLIVWAIAEGRSCAAAVDQHLAGATGAAGADPADGPSAHGVTRPTSDGSRAVPLASIGFDHAPRQDRLHARACHRHPSSQIRALVDAGMDVARLNLSHGTYDDHEAVYRNVRQAADEAGRGVGILVDLQGPKIRLGRLRRRAAAAAERRRAFTITTEDVPGDVERLLDDVRGPARRRHRR